MKRVNPVKIIKEASKLKEKCMAAIIKLQNFLNKMSGKLEESVEVLTKESKNVISKTKITKKKPKKSNK